MILADVLLSAWLASAAIAVVADSIFMFRSLTGRYGEAHLAETRARAARSGGVRRWVLVGLLLDFTMPWLMWEGLIRGFLDDDGMD